MVFANASQLNVDLKLSGTNAAKLDDYNIFGTSILLGKSANFTVVTRVEESGCKTKSYMKPLIQWNFMDDRYYLMVSTEPSVYQVKHVPLQVLRKD